MVESYYRECRRVGDQLLRNADQLLRNAAYHLIRHSYYKSTTVKDTVIFACCHVEAVTGYQFSLIIKKNKERCHSDHIVLSLVFSPAYPVYCVQNKTCNNPQTL